MDYEILGTERCCVLSAVMCCVVKGELNLALGFWNFVSRPGAGGLEDSLR